MRWRRNRVSTNAHCSLNCPSWSRSVRATRPTRRRIGDIDPSIRERITIMTIKVGDHLPATTFRVMTPDGPAPKTSEDVFKGKRMVLFAVPGAFTPTCHKNHLPGFLKNADAIKAKGIDAIAVTAVNDVFVMDAWKKASGAEGKIEFLADGNGDFVKALGLTFDASGIGLGL